MESISGPGRFTAFQGIKEPKRDHNIDKFFPDQLRNYWRGCNPMSRVYLSKRNDNLERIIEENRKCL